MKKYWLVFKISVQDIFEYPFDFAVHTFKYAFMVIMMSLVWLGVAKNNPNLPITPQETVSYFFLGAMLYSLSNFHTFYVEEDIKFGFLTKYLLKPISPFLYYITYQVSRAVVETILKILVIVPLLFFLGYGLTFSLQSIFLVLLFLPVIFIFSFNFFMIISTSTFWITEAWALRWGMTMVMRFLAGLLVPISFFNQSVQQILYFLPFEHLAYTPIQLLLHNISSIQALQAWLILVGWTVILSLFRLSMWNVGVNRYEGSGI